MKFENLEEKFNLLYKNISSENFIKMKALGGELPIYIVTYSPMQENDVVKNINKLIFKLKNKGISVLNIDLFELIIEILQKEKKLDKFLKLESNFPKKKFIENLKRVLDVNLKIIPSILNKIENSFSQVIFLTGAGKIFPIIRSHYILKGLEGKIKIPVILFFPGKYDGNTLNLFCKMKSGNHYRAFILDKINYNF